MLPATFVQVNESINPTRIVNFAKNCMAGWFTKNTINCDVYVRSFRTLESEWMNVTCVLGFPQLETNDSVFVPKAAISLSVTRPGCV